MAKRSSDKLNVFITGGTDGIGLRLVKLYAGAGDNVVATGRRSEDEFRASLQKTKNSDAITYIRADQNDPQSAMATVETGLVDLDWNHCDIAILNAGVGWSGNPIDEPASSIRTILNVNLTSHVMLARLLAPLLLNAPSGKLTLIGSTAHTGFRQLASYAAANGGLHGFARSLREEWRGHVSVQIIHPGPIATHMHGKAGLDTSKLRWLFLHPEYVARSIRHAIKTGRSPVTLNHFSRGLDLVSFGWMWRR